MARPRRTSFVAASCALAAVIAAGFGGTVTSADAADPCPNAVIRAQQGAGALPDCRAYELVNPPSLDIGDVVRTFGVSDDGERATWATLLPGPEALGDQFGSYAVGVRTPSGWARIDANLQLGDGGAREGGAGRIDPRAHSADFSRFVVRTPIATDLRDQYGSEDLYLLEAGTGRASWISYGEVMPDGRFGAPVWVGGTADLTRNVFSLAGAELFPGVRIDGLYARDGSRLELISLMPDGSPSPAATIAASAYDFGLGAPDVLAYLPAAHGGRHAVSDDATRVFFYSDSSATGALYERDTTAATTTAVSASQRAGEEGTAQPARFIAATHDGDVSFFESTEQLTAAAAPGGGIYRFRLSTGELDLVVPTSTPTGLAIGQAFLSDDSSHLYFASPRTLLPGADEGAFNLYVWTAAGGTRLALSAASGEPVRVSRNGRYAVVESAVTIAGSSNGDNRAVFEYDDVTGTVACASCRADGSPSAGYSYLYDVPTALMPPWYQSPRGISDDGKLFFTSLDRIVPADHTNAADVYEYDSGQVSLLSAGRGDDAAYFADNSDDGRNVFILSRTPFDGRDRDAGELDLYDVRADGGFPFSPDAVTVPCSGDDCQGPQGPPPSAPKIGSTAGRGKRPGGHRRPRALTPGTARGTSTRISVRAPGRGTLALHGLGLEPVSIHVPKSGTYRLRAALTVRARSVLARQNTFTTTATVVYREASGRRGSAAVKLTFKTPSTSSGR